MKSKFLKFGLVFVALLALVATVSAASRAGTAADAPETADGGSAVYIVQLSEAPLSSYRGGIEGLSPTNPGTLGQSKLDVNSPASLAYLAYLEAVHAEFLASVESELGRSLDVRYTYKHAFNGVALVMSPAEAGAVSALPGVTLVVQETFEVPLTDTGPSWIGAPGIWNGTSTGGLPGTYGEGVIVGVIDTGINVLDNHPSFSDIGGDGYDHTNPLPDYVGVCAGGNTDPNLTCNDKMIGYRGYNGETPGDSDGHGSHTASTAAGNFTEGTIAATIPVTLSISGVAPHANIIAYDACITSCPGAGLLAAVNDAVADGVDVINYSISGGGNPYGDAVELAFLNARDAGVFVSASAGNSGPGPNTVAHVSPWLTTVGASTHSRTWVNELINMSGGGAPPPDMTGRSISAGYGPAPIVHAGDFGDPLCGSPFPGGTWSGEIVVCDRGTFGRVQKGINVLAGGAGGYVLANVDAQGESINADAHALPAIHIGDMNGDALRAWLASGSGHTATITPGVYTLDPALGDIMAGFSSRGPVTTLSDLIKPDVTAPGVDIFAADVDPQDFGFKSGTSMSSPHNAGAGALLRALHPTWTPAEIQSALMSTALTTGVLKEDAATPADPFDMGAGRIDLTMAGTAGLIMNETLANYQAADPNLGGDPKTLNTPSMGNSACTGVCSWTRTVENALATTQEWDASLDLPAGATGSVTPNNFTLAPGATQDLTVMVDVSALPNDGVWRFGQLNLTPVIPLAPTAHTLYCSTDTPIAIPDNTPAGANSTVSVPDSGSITDINVVLTTTHTWVGDLVYTVTHGASSAVIFDRPGVPASTFGCSGNDVAATIDDEAATGVEAECGAGTPTIAGSFIGGDPTDPTLLSTAFDGQELNGNWTLNVSDNAGGDTGSLDGWCVAATFDAGPSGPPPQHLPIAVVPAAAAPDIDVTPGSLSATQAPNTTTMDMLTISNNGTVDLNWTIVEDNTTAPEEGPWSENFDSYADGSQIHGQGGWKGWGNNPAFGALVSSAQARSAPHSLDVNGSNDPVREFSGYTTGSWTFTAWQYIPTGATGETYFIMLNQYDDAGATNNWSVQVHMNNATGLVLADGVGAGPTLPIIYDQWVELRVEIDLDADLQQFFYDGTLLYQGSWANGVSGGGIANIGAVNLFANGASSVYYDDLSLVASAGAVCSAPDDIPWLSVNPTAGTTAPSSSDPVDVTFDSTGLAEGTYNGALCVNSDDPDTPTVIVTVELNVVGQPTIAVDPGSLTSVQQRDTVVTQTLTISNTGGGTLIWDLEEEAPLNPFGTPPTGSGAATEEVDGATFGDPVAAPPSSFSWPAVVLYDNGPLVNGSGTGVGGADESILQNTSLGMTTLGFGHQVSAGNWIADDFVVGDPGGWTVTDMTFFAYQTGSSTTSPMTNVNWIIFDGDPGAGGTPIFMGGGLDNTVWSNIYRVTETTSGSATNRPIMASTVGTNFFLNPGTYWVAWQTDGTLASGPWAPPITITGNTTTGNALQSTDNGASWAAANDGGTGTQQGFPFIIEGTVGSLCNPNDIPWLTASPTSGSNAGGTATAVDVVFDASGLAPDIYTGTLCISSNDAQNPRVDVPVTLEVTIPTDVSLTGFAGEDSAPLSGILVVTTLAALAAGYVALRRRRQLM